MHEVSLVFSSHRPETLQVSAPLMKKYDAIFLEDPPTTEFREYLQGTLSIDDYLMTLDAEYPEFTRLSCNHLKQLHTQGKSIIQIEPFLEVLIEIHAFFADGGDPSDIDTGSATFNVYQAEKNATGRLLDYYQTVMTGSFEKTIETVKAFARADAARLLLRDAMRAEALVHEVLKYAKSYVEAGYIHHALFVKLRKALAGRANLRPVFLMAPIVKPLLGKRQALGPGDILTLLYVYHPHFQKKEADLLAARSIVYIKLLEKEELEAIPGEYPHTRDEVTALQMVCSLSFEDCQNLYPHIRLAKTEDARSMVKAYLRSGEGENTPWIFPFIGLCF